MLVFKGAGSSADISTTDFSYVMKGEAEEVKVSFFLSFFFYFLFCEIEGNDDLPEIGVLPLLVTRQAAWRSTPPWRTAELG